MRDGTAEELCRALMNLVSALCRDDLKAIENASQKLQELLESGGEKFGQGMDKETLREIRNLIEAAQCLVWVRLLSVSESGAVTTNALVSGKV